MKIKCAVYRCRKKADTYLYLEAGRSLDELPEGLKPLLGDLTQFLDLELNESSMLARVKTSDVLMALAEQGYFLQMAPGDIADSQAPGSGYIQ